MRTREKETTVILQENTPFSQCQLWQWQKEFFVREGVEAWASQVPFYITSNPYIAHSYAQVIIRFMQDCIQQNPHQTEMPFYIVELGAGAGRFGFYCLKHLLRLQQTLQMEKIHFKYVMTDFNEQIVSCWEQHPALQNFIEKGVLDFAVYDVEQDETISLRKANIKIEKSASLVHPLIILANYVFDSISHDAFYTANGQLREGIVALEASSKTVVEGKPQSLEDIDVSFEYRPACSQHYPEPLFNTLLEQYSKAYQQNYFIFPIGGLRCIERLRELTQNNLLLLATDKGYVNTFDNGLQSEPGIAFHGSFSVMVNFDAIGRYVKGQGGECYFQTTRQSIATAAFLFNKTLAQLPETQQALSAYFDQYGPGNVYKIYKFIRQNKEFGELETFLTKLNIIHWDPHFFNACLEDILNHISTSSAAVLQDLYDCLPWIAENYYHLPAGDNTLFNIGAVYQCLSKPAEALHYYQLSLHYFKSTKLIYLNMGICYYTLQQYEDAVACFEEVLKQDPHHIMACGWLTYALSHLKGVAEGNKKILVDL